MQCFSTPDFKIDDKVFIKGQFFRTTQSSKKLFEKYLRPYEIISQPSILLFTLHLPEFICSVHPVFHVSMLEPTTFNSFSERTQLAPTLVIINREPKYEISWIVDSKIDCQHVTNFIQLVSPQSVDRFSQTKLRWKAPNKSYSHICGMYKSDNKRLRYQAISSCKSFVC